MNNQQQYVEELPTYAELSKMSDKQLTDLFGIRDFFVYELDFAAVAGANGTAQSSFTVQADANFLWQYGCYLADLAGATLTNETRVVPLVSCAIVDGGSGRQLSSGNVPIPSIFGTGMQPFQLPTPRFFRAQTQVNVSLLNFSASNTYNIKLQFIGTKFFKMAQA